MSPTSISPAPVSPGTFVIPGMMPASNPNFYGQFESFLHQVSQYVMQTYGVHLDVSVVRLPLMFTDNVTGTGFIEEVWASSPNFRNFIITVPEEYAVVFPTVPAMAMALLRQMALATNMAMPSPIAVAAPTPAATLNVPANPIGSPTSDGLRYNVAPGFPRSVGSKYTSPDGTSYVMAGTETPFGSSFYWVKAA